MFSTLPSGGIVYDSEKPLMLSQLKNLFRGGQLQNGYAACENYSLTGNLEALAEK